MFPLQIECAAVRSLIADVQLLIADVHSVCSAATIDDAGVTMVLRSMHSVYSVVNIECCRVNIGLTGMSVLGVTLKEHEEITQWIK
jgi:hypothetical protein